MFSSPSQFAGGERFFLGGESDEDDNDDDESTMTMNRR